MKSNIIIGFAILMASGLPLKGRSQTGTVINVEFSGIQRVVHVYVPQINQNDSVRLVIGLHGFGMTGEEFYDILKPIALNNGFILATIDGSGDRHDDELNGEEIHVIKHTLDTLLAMFPVDRNKVVLTGFSNGGRESLYYGTSNSKLFSGIIPFSASIMSRDDALNNFPVPWSEPFNYQAVDSLPICNCFSLMDIDFGNDISRLDSVLNSYNAVDTVINTNMYGHTIIYPSFSSDFSDCLNYIEATNKKLNNPTVGWIDPKRRGELKVLTSMVDFRFDVSDFKEVRIYNLLGEELGVYSSQTVSRSKLQRGVLIASVRTTFGEEYTRKIINP